MADFGKELRAKMDASWNAYRQFGQWDSGLKFTNSLPLETPPPAMEATGSLLLAEGQGLRLTCLRAPGGKTSFFLNDKLVPAGLLVHERSYISSLKEKRSQQGFDWAVKLPSCSELMKQAPLEFVRADVFYLARFHEDIVVHSAGIKTTLYIGVEPARQYVVLQYYTDFDG